MPDADRAKWDAIWAERGPMAPSSVLTALDPWLPRAGRALDVAGGAGRHARWLRDRGLDVTVADVSPAGLARVGDGIATRAVDLEQEPLPDGPWDLVLVFHFLWRPLVRDVARALAPGGTFVMIHPTLANLERHPRPSAAHLLAPGELRELAHGLDVVRYEEAWTVEDRHEAVLVARKA